MKYPTPDLYDRYSIELLKKVRANADNDAHLDALLIEIDARGNPAQQTQFIDQLVSINGQIWDLESDIRKGKEGELGLEEVGRRAIAIRNLNAVRVSIKNQIAEVFNEFQENKYQHASQ